MSETKTEAKLVLDLPMDEIRNGAISNLAAGNAASTVAATGAPKVIYDYYMGSSIGFYGKEFFKLNEVKIPAGQGCSIECWFNMDVCQGGGNTWQQLFYLKSNTSKDAWGVHTKCENQALYLFCFEPRQQTVQTVNKLETDKWIHLALVISKDGHAKTYINGVLANDYADQTLNQFVTNVSSLLIQIGAKDTIDFFHGKISQFKVFSGARSIEEIKVSMEEGRSANATFKSSYPVDFKLNSVDNGSENPVLYIENNTNGHPFKIDMINTSGTAVKYAGGPVKDFTLSENDYHIQLRFKKQVIADEVMESMLKTAGTNLNGWAYTAGKNATLLEDWISFKKITANADEEFKGLQSLTLNNMRAEAMAGARNTLVEIKYNNLYYKESQNILSGSLTRHLDIISHLGKRNAPFDASISGPSTLLNDGKTENKFNLVLRNITGEPVRFTAKDATSVQHSKFSLACREDKVFKDVPKISFVGDKFKDDPLTVGKNLPRLFDCTEKGFQLANTNDQLVIQLSNLITEHSSGTVTLYLEYKNIPGYWDGVIPITLHLGRIVEQDNKVGINKAPEKEKNYDLQVKGNVKVEGTIHDQTGYLMPVGAIIAYGGKDAPEGWLLCDGLTNLTTNPAYKELQKVLGLPATPDLRSRFILGASNDYALGKKEGLAKVELKKENMPKHNHGVTVDPANVVKETQYKVMGKNAYERALVYDVTGLAGSKMAASYDSYAQGVINIDNAISNNHTHKVTITDSGDGLAHENMPPYYALTYIIKY